MDLGNPKILQLLKERGLRPTSARHQILTLLIEYENHLSTEEILKTLRKKRYRVGAATIYQNLARLVDAGLITRFTGIDGLVRYDSNLMPHDHLICVKCGKVVDVFISLKGRSKKPKIQDTGKSLVGWRLDGVQLEFKGVCPDCLRNKKSL